MNISTENILLIGSILLITSILLGKTSFRFGIPTLLLFLVLGMISGSDGIGGIHFEDPKIAQFIGIISLNFILFSGGLDTNWNSIKPVLWIGVSLSTVGVLLTALGLGFFVYWLTDFTIYESLLLGSIVSSTDAAAVFSILRAKNLGLKTNLRPTLELESGSNDPMAYVLTIAFLGLVVNQDVSPWTMVPLFFQQMILGAGFGFLFGRISKYIINRINIDFEGLYPVLVIALMFLTFSITDGLGGNGFLAIYICAVYLGNNKIMHKKSILKAFDGFAWLMQIVLFLSLGLLVYPTEMLPVLDIGLLLGLFLIFVARPVGVFLSLLPFKMKMRRRWYISWVGLRGAVPIVFATYPLLEGIPKANMIFNLVFCITLVSILIQGTTLSIIAKWLHVAIPEKTKPLNEIERFLLESPKNYRIDFTILNDSPFNGKSILELKLPETINIPLIKRQEKFFTPSGNSILESEDEITVLAQNETDFKNLLNILNTT